MKKIGHKNAQNTQKWDYITFCDFLRLFAAISKFEV
jgi:hypothetical protein